MRRCQPCRWEPLQDACSRPGSGLEHYNFPPTELIPRFDRFAAIYDHFGFTDVVRDCMKLHPEQRITAEQVVHRLLHILRRMKSTCAEHWHDGRGNIIFRNSDNKPEARGVLMDIARSRWHSALLHPDSTYAQPPTEPASDDAIFAWWMSCRHALI